MTSTACFDTSVLVKSYFDEVGSRHAREVVRRFRPVCSAITPVEATSAIVRRSRGGELGPRATRSLLNRLRDDCAEWELVELQASVLSRAESIILDSWIATLDAVHIASALLYSEGLSRRVPFVTADARQRAAAERLNLDVVWVE